MSDEEKLLKDWTAYSSDDQNIPRVFTVMVFQASQLRSKTPTTPARNEPICWATGSPT